MKTIHITIDAPTLEEVDRLIILLNTTRSAFIRNALRTAIRKYVSAALEDQHTQGYAKRPVKPGEFDIWTKEQAWGDE